MSSKVSFAVLGITAALAGCGGGGGGNPFLVTSDSFAARNAAFENLGDIAGNNAAPIPASGNAIYDGSFRIGVPVATTGPTNRTEEIIGRAQINIAFSGRNLTGTFTDLVGSTDPNVAGTLAVTPVASTGGFLRGRADGQIEIGDQTENIFLSINSGILSGNDGQVFNAGLGGASGFAPGVDISGNVFGQRR